MWNSQESGRDAVQNHLTVWLGLIRRADWSLDPVGGLAGLGSHDRLSLIVAAAPESVTKRQQ